MLQSGQECICHQVSVWYAAAQWRVASESHVAVRNALEQRCDQITVRASGIGAQALGCCVSEAFLERKEIPCAEPDAINVWMCIVAAGVGDVAYEASTQLALAATAAQPQDLPRITLLMIFGMVAP